MMNFMNEMLTEEGNTTVHYDEYNEVFEGKITSIEKLHLSLMDKEEGLVIIKFENIKKVANTDWLCGSDIRGE